MIPRAYWRTTLLSFKSVRASRNSIQTEAKLRTASSCKNHASLLAMVACPTFTSDNVSTTFLPLSPGTLRDLGPYGASRRTLVDIYCLLRRPSPQNIFSLFFISFGFFGFFPRLAFVFSLDFKSFPSGRLYRAGIKRAGSGGF
ncbi:hypothetical protein CEXT_570521 [Caerostris extrusa]|uniref:Uncharacterized protein n=1 Tax=Caerostris extrusa TaxID=172846 RepID=A0AAV4N0X5_CAEEX|nr:hypothetical protein CEXT_570521 [Caerostris extrusa]